MTWHRAVSLTDTYMHFVVIAAFALVLTARTPTKSWWLFTSIPMTYQVVAGQIAVILLLTLGFSVWSSGGSIASRGIPITPNDCSRSRTCCSERFC